MADAVDLDLVRNVLTLRYDPTKKNTFLPNLGWKDAVPEPASATSEDVETRLKGIIKNFVNREKPASITLALSGGIDSLLMLTLFREVFPDMKITCLSAGFSENDEEVNSAREIARHFGTDFETLILDNFLDNLPQQIAIVGEPKWHYYWFYVAQKAKRFSDILVTGDGGDELFGGYVFRYKQYLDTIKPGDGWAARASTYLQCHNRDWVDDQEKMFGPAARFDWKGIYNLLRGHFDNQLGSLEQVLLADYGGKLTYDWVPALDKIHSHFDMKGFSPMLDHDLIRFAFHVPVEKKYDRSKNLGKLPLREILGKKKFKSEFNKKGFSPDLSAFWKNHGKNLIRTYLGEDSRTVKNQLINKDWIPAALDRSEKDIRYVTKLLSVLALEVWYRLTISLELKETDRLF
ncbi:MAG TPA: asparagine synthase C-terminal domain-containing protein [Candidatus Nitrosotalea sp.]|nr:asparagine synthase C-terminal domain-containing protein [Candidatus Nitrosotalea sp.]